MFEPAPDTFGESAVTLRFGYVSELDATHGRVRVRLPDLDDLQTHWLPVLHSKTQRDQHWHLPDLGEHVALLLDRRGESGCVLGALYSQRNLPPVTSPDRHHVRFADGTTIDYDRAAHRLSIQCVGDVEIVSSTRIALRAPRIDLN